MKYVILLEAVEIQHTIELPKKKANRFIKIFHTVSVACSLSCQRSAPFIGIQSLTLDGQVTKQFDMYSRTEIERRDPLRTAL